MSELNCPILDMQSKKVSLEEIFLELTETDTLIEDNVEKEEKNHDSNL